MTLRYDLAKEITPEMVLEEAVANQHRYKAEPLFSQTGVGSLLSASTSDSAAEVARSMVRIQKLTQVAKKNGAEVATRKGPSLKR